MEDYTPLLIGTNGELHINVIEQFYDEIEYNDYKVFVSKEDYDIYLEICEYNKTEEIIVAKKRNIQQLKQKLETEKKKRPIADYLDIRNKIINNSR